MGFEGLLGNHRLKENMAQAVRRGRIAHFYLISGPAGSGKRTLARLLAAAVLCKNEEKPCLACSACRKVMANTHPDFITIDDSEKKTVPVELIRKARADIYIQPNEADRKIYLFPRAQDMGVPGQNALLKVLEEPPSYGVFILLTDNPESLLPTVRSRCTELSLLPLPDKILKAELARRFPKAQSQELGAAAARSGGYLGQAIELLESGQMMSEETERFARAIIAKDRLELLRLFAPMEKWKRDQVIPLLQQWTLLVQEALMYRSGVEPLTPIARELGTTRSASELLGMIRLLKQCTEFTQGNASVGGVCAYLLWHL